MSAMEESADELQNHFQSQSVPPPPQNVNFHELATEQVRQQGPGLDPSQAQLAIFLATLQIKSEHEAKLSRYLLQKTLKDTVTTVNTHTQDIVQLRDSTSKTETGVAQLEHNQTDIYTQLSRMHELTWKTYIMAAETKQKGSKGNFTISGDGIPPPSPQEDLYAVIFPLVYQKYGVHVYPNELKALHRLPNNKIFFSLLTRLPGQSFERLTRAMNSNPKAHIKIYLTIQLFEPFAELHYVARRLKHYKVISNYRLDENGNSFIALNMNSQSFKLTGLEQLEALQIPLPPQIREEINFRRIQIQQNEEKTAKANNEKAFKDRTNFPPQNPNQPPATRPNYVPASNQQTQAYPNNSHPLPRAPTPHTQDTLYRPPAQVHTTQASVRPQAAQSRHPRPVRYPSSSQRTPPQGSAQASFRGPPPRYTQPPVQSPQYPHPPSYLTTPPPGEGTNSAGQGHSNGRGESVSIFQHSDPATHTVNEQVYFQM